MSKKNKVLEQNKKKNIGLGVITLGVCLVCVFVILLMMSGTNKNKDKIEYTTENISLNDHVEHELLTANNGEIFLDSKQFQDSKAKHYKYKFKDGFVYFFIVKSADGKIRAAFDACDVCYRSKRGYSQAGDYMVCNNCGRRFHTDLINVEQGGCNPAPLFREEKDGKVRIKVENVYTGLHYFV